MITEDLAVLAVTEVVSSHHWLILQRSLVTLSVPRYCHQYHQHHHQHHQETLISGVVRPNYISPPFISIMSSTGIFSSQIRNPRSAPAPSSHNLRGIFTIEMFYYGCTVYRARKRVPASHNHYTSDFPIICSVAMVVVVTITNMEHK